jgi:hypothetical protein
MHDIRYLQRLHIVDFHQRQNRWIPEFKLNTPSEARGGKGLGVGQRAHGIRSSHESSRSCHHQVAVGDCYAELPLSVGLQLGDWPWQSGIALISSPAASWLFLEAPQSVSPSLSPEPELDWSRLLLALTRCWNLLFQCDIRLVSAPRLCTRGEGALNNEFYSGHSNPDTSYSLSTPSVDQA